ncbi:TNT domain-containing protein [Pseudomonas sp. 39167]|uniref:TNT domain-containing protein n=1 Tax=Pseudomonas sp. 39167 TaxID=2967215 RepID=UPI0023635BE6|nr:TNT domain-containing protein [Pseudomonas sp. 39167]MDD2029994.1 TNT domain-containing protein [Pseudomonas sp. 39167]
MVCPRFCQSGISRDLSSGLAKELKDSGIAVKDGAINLYDAARENPKAVMGGLWEGVKGLPQSVVDSFHESGNAIGEGAAVALDSEMTAKLNAIYGVDVSTAQQALLFIRTASAITMAGTGAKVGGKLAGAAAEAVGKKLDEILEDAAKKAQEKNDNLQKSQPSIGAIADNEAGGFSYYDQFKKADGSWDWPKNLGFAGSPVKNTLPVGTKLDRYGGPEGSFLSPLGVPFDQRSLAPGSRAGEYYQYEVLKPMPVVQGEIAPAFGQPGGGTQILPDLSERYNVDRLVKEGYLRRTN